MKKLLFAAIAATGIACAFVPTQSQAQVRFGIGIGDGYYGGYPGYGYGYPAYGYRWHHRHHCRWIPIWRHHHRIWVKQCGWGGPHVYMGY